MILVWAFVCCYFQFAAQNFKEALIQEHRARCVLDIACICGTIDYLVDKNKDWNNRDYLSVLQNIVSTIDATGAVHESLRETESTLINAVSIIDATGGTHASLYDRELNLLSNRTPLFDGTLININDYPEVKEACNANLSGYMTINVFKTVKVPPHKMYLYWRWVPTDAKYTNKYLILIGVSQYSVNTQIAKWIKCGSTGVVIIATVYTVGALLAIFISYRKRRKTDLLEGAVRER